MNGALYGTEKITNNLPLILCILVILCILAKSPILSLFFAVSAYRRYDVSSDAAIAVMARASSFEAFFLNRAGPIQGAGLPESRRVSVFPCLFPVLSKNTSKKHYCFC